MAALCSALHVARGVIVKLTCVNQLMNDPTLTSDPPMIRVCPFERGEINALDNSRPSPLNTLADVVSTDVDSNSS